MEGLVDIKVQLISYLEKVMKVMEETKDFCELFGKADVTWMAQAHLGRFGKDTTCTVLSQSQKNPKGTKPEFRGFVWPFIELPKRI